MSDSYIWGEEGLTRRTLWYHLTSPPVYTHTHNTYVCPHTRVSLPPWTVSTMIDYTWYLSPLACNQYPPLATPRMKSCCYGDVVIEYKISLPHDFSHNTSVKKNVQVLLDPPSLSKWPSEERWKFCSYGNTRRYKVALPSTPPHPHHFWSIHQ